MGAKSQLRVQLENYRLIVEVNQELFDKNVPARDELADRFRAAQLHVDQLGQPGDQADQIIMLDDANLIVAEICAHIKRILDQDSS